MEKISIIIPVYNAENDLYRCMESLKKQTFQSFETIFVNDGSSDGSLNVLELFKSENPGMHIKIITQQNSGVAVARNEGMKVATASYIMFVDNDDILDSRYLEVYYKAIQDQDDDIVLGGYRRVSDSKVLFKKKMLADEYTKYVVTAPWAKIYRKSFLLENNIQFLDYPIGEDVYFNMLAYQKTSKIKIIDYIGYDWYFNQASISNTSQRGFNKKIDILYLLDKLNNIEINSSQRQYIEYYYRRYITWYLLFSGKNARVEDFMKEYRRVYPWLRSNNIKGNICFLSSKIKGDTLGVRVSVFGIKWLTRLKLVPLFARVYCKGDK